MIRKFVSVGVGLALASLIVSRVAGAAPKNDAGVAVAAAPVGALDAGAGVVDAGAATGPAQASGCIESIPSGGQRPTIADSFPDRAFSGYAATLRVTVEHGKGETVLPNGLSLQSGGDAAKALRDAAFVIPDQDGGAAARLTPGEPSVKEDRTRTILELPLVPLPKEGGRHVLTLPPLPVAVARSNGEIATVCTRPHTIVVDDPIASSLHPTPMPNPPARTQREEWTSLKKALEWGTIGLLAGALIAYAIRKWMTRPKPVAPPPPPRPPWEVAFERLDEVRHAGLLEVGRFGEYFDRVSDALRNYLGALYGFDGLESTSDEIILALRKARVQGISLPEVIAFLQDCDLVKFANFTPPMGECTRVLEAGERIVHATMPRMPAFQASPRPLDRPPPFNPGSGTTPPASRPPEGPPPGDEGRSQ